MASPTLNSHSMILQQNSVLSLLLPLLTLLQLSALDITSTLLPSHIPSSTFISSILLLLISSFLSSLLSFSPPSLPSQVATLHTASTSRTFGLDLEPILDILCTASRAQCGAISAEYLKKHKMTLVAAIQKKFSGVAAKALGEVGVITDRIIHVIVCCRHHPRANSILHLSVKLQ